MIGERIKKLRNENDISLKELSNEIDMSISFISDIENGRSMPSLKRLLDIKEGLDTSILYLLYGVPIDGQLVEVFKNPKFQDILQLFKDFEQWSDEDIEDLKNYIKLKKKNNYFDIN